MPQLSLDPIFLLDDSLSYRFAEALAAATGYDVRTIRSEWPKRDPFVNPVQDEEIIPHLGPLARHRGIWITCDKDAQKAHAKLLMASQISVLWVYQPKRAPLKGLQELQLLSLVIERVYALIAQAQAPMYLKTYMNVQRPRLERLAGTLNDKRLLWERIKL